MRSSAARHGQAPLAHSRPRGPRGSLTPLSQPTPAAGPPFASATPNASGRAHDGRAVPSLSLAYPSPMTGPGLASGGLGRSRGIGSAGESPPMAGTDRSSGSARPTSALDSARRAGGSLAELRRATRRQSLSAAEPSSGRSDASAGDGASSLHSGRSAGGGMSDGIGASFGRDGAASHHAIRGAFSAGASTLASGGGIGMGGSGSGIGIGGGGGGSVPHGHVAASADTAGSSSNRSAFAVSSAGASHTPIRPGMPPPRHNFTPSPHAPAGSIGRHTIHRPSLGAQDAIAAASAPLGDAARPGTAGRPANATPPRGRASVGSTGGRVTSAGVTPLRPGTGHRGPAGTPSGLPLARGGVRPATSLAPGSADGSAGRARRRGSNDGGIGAETFSADSGGVDSGAGRVSGGFLRLSAQRGGLAPAGGAGSSVSSSSPAGSAAAATGKDFGRSTKRPGTSSRSQRAPLIASAPLDDVAPRQQPQQPQQQPRPQTPPTASGRAVGRAHQNGPSPVQIPRPRDDHSSGDDEAPTAPGGSGLPGRLASPHSYSPGRAAKAVGSGGSASGGRASGGRASGGGGGPETSSVWAIGQWRRRRLQPPV